MLRITLKILLLSLLCIVGGIAQAVAQSNQCGVSWNYAGRLHNQTEAVASFALVSDCHIDCEERCKSVGYEGGGRGGWNNTNNQCYCGCFNVRGCNQCAAKTGLALSCSSLEASPLCNATAQYSISSTGQYDNSKLTLCAQSGQACTSSETECVPIVTDALIETHGNRNLCRGRIFVNDLDKFKGPEGRTLSPSLVVEPIVPQDLPLSEQQKAPSIQRTSVRVSQQDVAAGLPLRSYIPIAQQMESWPYGYSCRLDIPDAGYTLSSQLARSDSTQRCGCPVNFMRLLSGYQQSSWFNVIASPNQLTNVCDSCGSTVMAGLTPEILESELLSPGRAPATTMCLRSFSRVDMRAEGTSSGLSLTPVFTSDAEIKAGLVEFHYTKLQAAESIRWYRERLQENDTTLNTLESAPDSLEVVQVLIEQAQQYRPLYALHRMLDKEFTEFGRVTKSLLREAAEAHALRRPLPEGALSKELFDEACFHFGGCGLGVWRDSFNALFEVHQYVYATLEDIQRFSSVLREPRILLVTQGIETFTESLLRSRVIEGYRNLLTKQKRELEDRLSLVEQLLRYLECPGGQGGTIVRRFDEAMSALSPLSLNQELHPDNYSSRMSNDPRVLPVVSERRSRATIELAYLYDLVASRREALDTVSEVNALIGDTAVNIFSTVALPHIAVHTITRGFTALVPRSRAMMRLALRRAAKDGSAIAVKNVMLGADILMSVGAGRAVYHAVTRFCDPLATTEDLKVYFTCIREVQWSVSAGLMSAASASLVAQRVIGSFPKPKPIYGRDILDLNALRLERNARFPLVKVGEKFRAEVRTLDGTDIPEPSMRTLLTGSTPVYRVQRPSGAIVVVKPDGMFARGSTVGCAASEAAATDLAVALGYGENVLPTEVVRVSSTKFPAQQGRPSPDGKLTASVKPFIEGDSYARLELPPENVSRQGVLYDLLIGDLDRTLTPNLENVMRERSSGREIWFDFGRAFQPGRTRDIVTSFNGVEDRYLNLQQTNEWLHNVIDTPGGREFISRLSAVSDDVITNILNRRGLARSQVAAVIQRRRELLEIAQSCARATP
jgi:hypothetical protein